MLQNGRRCATVRTIENGATLFRQKIKTPWIDHQGVGAVTLHAEERGKKKRRPI